MLTHELFEMHYADLFPQTFSVFHTKYAPLVNDSTLYVNFTDDVGDPINKSFSPRPNHRDPTGLYAYPLDYVIKHPSEIEYGQQARFLRVIRDTSKHKLNLSTLNVQTAITLLTRMGVEEPEKKMAMVQRRFRYAGGNLAAKQFFGVLQMYLEVGQKMVTSNQEQTARLLRAGVDAIEDKSGNSMDAIIFHAEPEQCVFLARSAFKVIEVFELRSERSINIHRSDPRELLRRLPGLIAQGIGDRIVANNLTAERGSRMSFYTATGRKIVVMMESEYKFLVGHRQGNIYSGDKVQITLMGPDFQPISETYPVEMTFEEIAADMAKRFASRTPAQGERYDLMSEYGPEIKQVNDTLALVAEKLKVPFTPANNTSTAFRIFSTVKAISAENRWQYASNREEFLAILKTTVERLWPKPRNPQGQQILQIWQTAASKRRLFSTPDLHSLDHIASKLGITGWGGLKKEGEAYAKQYGDLTLFRRGDWLMFKLGDHDEKIAKIDNLKLEDWQKPQGEGTYNHRLLLPYASALVDYLNENKFVVDGYHTYLPQFFGISFVDGRWHQMEDVSENMGTFGPVTIWKLPADRRDDHYVVAVMEGERDNSDMGAVPNELWRSQLHLFSINAANEVTDIGHSVANYLRSEQQEKKHPSSYHYKQYPEDLYLEAMSRHPENPGPKTWLAMEKNGFDLFNYIKQKGYTLSPKMRGDLQLFGLLLNADNDKVGKTYEEVVNPVGEFNGIEMYSIMPIKDQWSRRIRYFVFLVNGKVKEAVRCEPDANTSRHEIKVVWIADDLTPEQRVAVREMLTSKSLTVPSKFARNLSVKRFSK